MRNFLLKRIQADPNEITYNRLLIWLLIQEKNFPAAIRQAVALDKRTGQEEGNIFGLANIASSNKDYDDAAKAYDYLVSKGKNADYYYPAVQQQVHMQYNRFAEEDPMNMEKARALQDKFDQTLKLLGTNAETSLLISEYAHLLAFYLDKAEDAINLLNEAVALPQLNQEQLAILKTELSDVNVYAGNLWDAVLSYSQVIESNKNNSLGDDVKFKKAKLGYYMGNFQWAKAQLDALRASTSKLIANDAMELSLFINENMDDDSTAAPLRIFARADLQMFRNNFAGTLAALDSITKLYPYNSLEDDVNFRKAAILQKQGKYAEAAEILESIVTNNGSDMLADDALFQLAEIYRNHLNQKDKATECYKKMLTDYPGSIYVVDSRTEYRKLQDSMKTDAKPDSEKTKEDLFFEGKSPNP
jgi:TolA-binding protein